MRNVLVTGATGGIGRALVKALDRAGYRCVIHFLKNSLEAERLASSMRNPAVLVQADLRDALQVKQMINSLRSKISTLYAIINCAAITIDKPLLRVAVSEWDRVIETNVKGIYLVTKEALLLMQEGGHIVNISSYAGIRGRRGQTPYSASKAALVGMSLSMARELADRQIKVNVVVPGFLPVGMGERADSAREVERNRSLLKRTGSIEDLVNFILYLLGTESVTGQVFVIDSRL